MLRPTILALALSFAWPLAVQAAPLSPQSVQNVEQLMATGKLDDATASIKTLIKRDPGNARMHYYLAQIHAANGNWTDAGVMLKKAKYFDWRLKFASSKQRVADFEKLIEARKKDPTAGADTDAHETWITREKQPEPEVAPVEIEVEVEPPAFLTIKPPEKIVHIETPKQRNFLWFFASAVALIGVSLVVMVRRFNIQNTHRNARLAEAAIKEQKIVLSDLIRVLNDIEAITKSENLNNLYAESTILLAKVHSLMSKLEQNELQSIGDIELYVRKTQLYRSHCTNLIDLPLTLST